MSKLILILFASFLVITLFLWACSQTVTPAPDSITTPILASSPVSSTYQSSTTNPVQTSTTPATSTTLASVQTTPSTITPAPSTTLSPTTANPLIFSDVSLTDGSVNVDYKAILQAQSGTQPYTWKIISGTFPPGLTLNSSSGVITGLPTTAGSFLFRINVMDAIGNIGQGNAHININKVDYGNLPLGETGGLCYVNGSFNHIITFKSLYIDITLYDEPSGKDGLRFVLYNSQINNINFNFSLNRDIAKGDIVEKSLSFFKWGTNNLVDVKTAPSGLSYQGTDKNPFVELTVPYNWMVKSYRFKLAYTESDFYGDWYGLWLIDKETGNQEFAGSIRFAPARSNNGISPVFTTTTNLPYKYIQQTPIPTWHVSIDGMYATDQGRGDLNLTSDYSGIDHTDVYYDSANKKIQMVIGPQIKREHLADVLFNGTGFSLFK
jgi:hypothetical protein